MRHPLGQREPDAAALGKPRHYATSRPVIAQATHGPDQRIAVRGEREWPVHDLLDAGAPDGWEVLEADLEMRRQALQIVGQELHVEVPRRLVGRPHAAVLLVGAHQDALALLAHVDLTGVVGGRQQLLGHRGHLGHLLGDDVHVLHGEHG